MVLNGIPISEDQCISDSLQYINSAFQTLSTNVYSVSASFNALSAKDSSTIDLDYNSSTKTLTATLALTAQDGQRMTYSSTLSAFVGARSFPTWNSTPQTSAVNNQIGNSGFLNYQRALTDVIRNNRDIVGDRLTTPSGTINGLWSRGILLKDGRVFLPPVNTTTARIYNPSTNAITVPGGTFGGPEYIGACLLPDGRVFVNPHTAPQAAIWDYVTETVTNSGSWSGLTSQGVVAIVLPSGKIFTIPGYSGYAHIWDPVTGTVFVPATPIYAYVSGGAYAQSATLLPDGKIFVPIFAGDGTARIYDPVTTLTTTTVGGLPQFTSKVVLLPNGKVFCTSYTTASDTSPAPARIYDPITNTVSTPSGGSNFGSGDACVLPNGKVLIVGFGGGAHIYDPLTDTSRSVDIGMSSVSYGGLTLMQNGKVFVHNGTTARIYDPTSTYQSVSLDMNFVTSPYVNFGS
jgi:hypothetical protein